MSIPKPNPGKNLTIVVQGISYQRIPIKTHTISQKDDLFSVVDHYTKPYGKSGDSIAISERVVAITQGRSYPISSINPSLFARALYQHVYKHPGGIGLRSPYTMELAIREAGLVRILIAVVAAIVSKPFGIRGIFYQVAGNNIAAIDGPTPYSLPPSDKSAKLPPKDPQKAAQRLEKDLGYGIIIIDANDYGVSVLGASSKAKSANWPIKKIFADNPMGQAREQTPIVIVRQVGM